MAELSNTAKLPEGRKVDKNSEVTPDPEVLKAHAHVVTVKPSSRVVLVFTKGGELLARYFDEKFAREEFKEAGIDFEALQAGAVLKRETDAVRAAKRTLARPDRRLRSERRKGRAADAAPAEAAA